MKIIFGLIVPFLLILLPTVFQVVFTLKRIRHKTQLPIIASFLMSLLVGLFIPLFAFNISADALTSDWPKDQPHCLTGITLFLIVGYPINIIGCILIGIVGKVMYVAPREHI